MYISAYSCVTEFVHIGYIDKNTRTYALCIIVCMSVAGDHNVGDYANILVHNQFNHSSFAVVYADDIVYIRLLSTVKKSVHG